MTEAQQRWLQNALDRIADELRLQPGFQEDRKLKDSYVIIHTATSAVMLDATEEFAALCAGWCGKKADEIDRSGFSAN